MRLFTPKVRANASRGNLPTDILRNRGLPPRISYAPPEPELVDAIVKSTSPILLALDRHEPQSSLKVQASS